MYGLWTCGCERGAKGKLKLHKLAVVEDGGGDGWMVWVEGMHGKTHNERIWYVE